MRPVKNIQYLLFFYLSFLITSKNLLKKDRYLVELIVFSGRENPKFILDTNEYKELLNRFSIENSRLSNKSTYIMGYKGFKVTNLSNPEKLIFIKNFSNAELYLLKKIKQKLSETVYDYILEHINSSNHKTMFITNLITKTTPETLDEDQCTNLPIVGTDLVPDFNPDKDDRGCFIKNLALNNCYNYGNDIVSNTFAQPGRGSGNKWKQLTCEDIKRAAESDGLKWIGRDFPNEKPVKGHYIALLMWQMQDFHWIRLDSNGYWSHKPGENEIKNVDNNGNFITDPSIQDFSPWTEFCGYFITVPSVTDEKRYVAKDYKASGENLWPYFFTSKKTLSESELNKLKIKSFFTFTSFYVFPFAITSVFSVLMYPKFVYFVKNVFRVKSFFSINMAILPFLLFFNVRVFSLSQTYIGFKIIENSYNQAVRASQSVNSKENEFHGKYYYKLRDKFLEVNKI